MKKYSKTSISSQLSRKSWTSVFKSAIIDTYKDG